MNLDVIIQQAIAASAPNRTLSFDQLNELVASKLEPGEELGAEDVNAIMDALSNNGICIIEVEMSDDEIDQRILELADPVHYRKVLRIVLEIGQSLPQTGEAKYHHIAERIVALVADGRLEGQRDLTDWSVGEVRRSQKSA